MTATATHHCESGLRSERALINAARSEGWTGRDDVIAFQIYWNVIQARKRPGIMFDAADIWHELPVQDFTTPRQKARAAIRRLRAGWYIR